MQQIIDTIKFFHETKLLLKTKTREEVKITGNTNLKYVEKINDKTLTLKNFLYKIILPIRFTVLEIKIDKQAPKAPR